MLPSFEPREWGCFAICAGVVTILLGFVAATIMVFGLGVARDVQDLLFAVSFVLLIPGGICLIGCGITCARLGSALEEREGRIRALVQRLAELDRPESAEPDPRIKPLP
jgi:hypothetical protein